MQCWLYSIRVQIIMSHFFHIKKKSIIISIVLVKFLTIVRWMYKIPSERGHKSTSTLRTNACVKRKLQFSKLRPKNMVESAHTEPRRSMIAICFGIFLSFTMSSMLSWERKSQAYVKSNLFSNYLNLVKKCNALSNNWPLMVGSNGEETNCFSQ